TSLAVACSSCGTDLPDGAAFCHSCGAKVGEPAAAAEEASDTGLRRYIPSELLNKLESAATTGGMVGERRTVTML
ncbi:MAG: zinc-ribbon domain-containing protein, partial [Actinobacteria bacterium]|nr:zinc ribbon domain-containing protein [Actinomycetota bacterium]NIS31932.1 zinc ribbon domain-containing protein [Actinomycetota bacterium]NIU67025.1 zinc ribbon domain-containing protein [Actinomycetota bacterium]NIV87593.1 zinc-ribbon domain-containing protein [Actinomycetota bacterium]NIW28815.1 zinc-ribbon domain-containing protein [Actinomycetota bacterium]